MAQQLVRTVLLLSGQSNRLAVVDSVSLALEQVRSVGSATPMASELRAGIASLCSERRTIRGCLSNEQAATWGVAGLLTSP